MQFQCDILKKPVIRPEVGETTALGAAFAAGLQVGIWKDVEELTELRAIREQYTPAMSDYLREKNWRGWQKAVSRSLDWIEHEDFEASSKKSFPFKEYLPYLAISGLAVGVGFVMGQAKKK